MIYESSQVVCDPGYIPIQCPLPILSYQYYTGRGATMVQNLLISLHFMIKFSANNYHSISTLSFHQFCRQIRYTSATMTNI